MICMPAGTNLRSLREVRGRSPRTGAHAGVLPRWVHVPVLHPGTMRVRHAHFCGAPGARWRSSSRFPRNPSFALSVCIVYVRLRVTFMSVNEGHFCDICIGVRDDDARRSLLVVLCRLSYPYSYVVTSTSTSSTSTRSPALPDECPRIPTAYAYEYEYDYFTRTVRVQSGLLRVQ